MAADHAAFLRKEYAPSWCPGCSFYQVLDVLVHSFAGLGYTPDDPVVVSGIGCSSRMPLFLSTSGMHTLHGRALPFAFGCQCAQPERPVVVVAGDGDLFSIGTNHFVHAARNNVNITVLCLDNHCFAMTKNQSSPTSPAGYCGSLTPKGTAAAPLNVIELAIAVNASLVARTSAASPEHMKTIFSAALSHRGFAFVHVVAPCRTYDPEGKTIFEELTPENIEDDHSFDPSNRSAALLKAACALEYQKSDAAALAVGIYYRNASPVPIHTAITQEKDAETSNKPPIIREFLF